MSEARDGNGRATALWRPPGPPGPPWPQDCYSGLYRLEQCWEDVKKTKAFLTQIIKDILAEDPSVIGLGQPVIGVTDGSYAQLGMVGETWQFTASQAYPAVTTWTDLTMVLGVLPPGDWDATAWAGFTTPIDGSFRLNPVPDGFGKGGPDDPLLHADMHMGVLGRDGGMILSAPVRALTAAPSLIAFTLSIRPLEGTAGDAQMSFFARRRR